MPRPFVAVFALLLLPLAVAPVAGAQESPTIVIAHDESLDGTPSEIRSGFHGADPPSGDPLAARSPNTYETFPVDVPAGTRHSRLEASIGWTDQRVDLDLAIYRVGADGRPAAPALGRSMAKGRASESAFYAPPGATVEPGRYLVVVDNVCSRDADRRPDGTRANCGIQPEAPDEDDFEGTVTLGNQAPEVTLSCPASVRAKETAAFRAQANDPDGTISTYLFDMDGDGTYELDSDGMPEVSTVFPSRGRRKIGVQVLDDSGAAAFATCDLTVARAARVLDPRPPLTTFKLNRRSFGGSAGRTLVVTYRLREKARVEVKLRRGDRLVRLIDRGVRKGKRYYRIRLKPAHLRRARYTVRIFVQAASGKRQVEELAARRR